MLVPLAVIAHGAALGDGPGVLERDGIALGGGEQKLHGVDGLAHIAPAGGGNVEEHPVLEREGGIPAGVHDVHGPLGGFRGVLGRNGLELKDGRAAQNRVEHREVGVFGRGGDERDAPVLDEFQKGLLLLFVEVLDLVEV